MLFSFFFGHCCLVFFVVIYFFLCLVFLLFSLHHDSNVPTNPTDSCGSLPIFYSSQRIPILLVRHTAFGNCYWKKINSCVFSVLRSFLTAKIVLHAAASTFYKTRAWPWFLISSAIGYCFQTKHDQWDDRKQRAFISRQRAIFHSWSKTAVNREYSSLQCTTTMQTPEKKKPPPRWVNKFKPSWTTEFKCIKASRKGDGHAFCDMCRSDFSISHGGYKLLGYKLSLNRTTRGRTGSYLSVSRQCSSLWRTP